MRETLKSFIKSQLEYLEFIKEMIEQKFPCSDEFESKVSLGYLLHNFYGVVEEIMKNIAKEFENSIEDSSKYHIELLRRMTLEVEGVRPKLFSEESFGILNELRSFRHVFRHLYTKELIAERVNMVAEILLKGYDRIVRDIQSFVEKI